MLEFFRQNVKSWLFVVVIILIVASFALFGVNEFLVDKSDTYIATVDGEEIPVAEYRNLLRDRQNSDELSEEEKSDLVERLVSQKLLLAGLGDLNLRPSDRAVSAQILSEPLFQENGKFDQERYANALRLRGYTIEAYEESLRNSLSFEQFTSAIEETAFDFNDAATHSEILADLQQQLQRRSYVKAVLTDSLLTETITVSEAEVLADYEANKESYRVGRGVKLFYIALNAEDYGNAPTDKEVESFYESRRGSYSTPDQFDLSYIVLTDDELFPEDNIEAINEILSSSSTATSFAEILSGVKGIDFPESITIDSGDLGAVDQSIIEDLYDKELGAQLSSLSANQVIGLKTKPNEYSIFYVNQILAGERIPLSEVRGEIEKQLRLEDAYPKLAQAQEMLEIAAFENPLSLEPAAEALGVSVETSDWLYEDGTGDATFNSVGQAVSYAFSENANVDGYNSDIFETETGMMIVRFAEEKASEIKPVSEVASLIERQLVVQKRQDALANLAGQLLLDAQSEPLIVDLQEKGLSKGPSEALDRRSVANIDGVTVANIVFSQESGVSSASHFPISDSARAIVWVDSIVDVDADSELVNEQLSRVANQQQTAVGIQEENSLLDLYREQADVIINESQL